MNIKLAGGLFAALLLSVAPAYAQPSDAPATTNQTAPAATPAPEKPRAGSGSIDIPAPPAGKGQVVFFRKSAFAGAAIWFKVRENGVEYGKLTPGTYIVVVAEPGDHTYSVATENKDTLRLAIDPGETYFVEGKITMGIMVGEASIAPSSQAAFDKASAHLKLAKPPAS